MTASTSALEDERTVAPANRFNRVMNRRGLRAIIDLIGKRIEAIIDLFDIEAPTGANIGPWLWKLAGKLFNVAFGGLSDIANAIRAIFSRSIAFAQKFIITATNSPAVICNETSSSARNWVSPEV